MSMKNGKIDKFFTKYMCEKDIDNAKIKCHTHNKLSKMSYCYHNRLYKKSIEKLIYIIFCTNFTKRKVVFMLQQEMISPGNIKFREVPVPKAKKGQLVIKIMKIGICGSDIHVYHGKHPFTKYPVTQGHEVSGSVFEIGEDVSGFEVGQKVTIQPQIFAENVIHVHMGNIIFVKN